MENQSLITIQPTNLQKQPESLNKVLAEQPDKEATRLYLAGLLIRLAEVYGLQFSAGQSVIMADWILENYKYDTLKVVVQTLMNPPALEDKVWRINPDTIRAWMSVSLDKLAERREIYIHNKKNDDKEFEVNYQAFKKRLDEEREQQAQKSRREREGRIEQLSYQPLSDEAIILKELHLQWIKECFDPLTGKPNDKWISEDEFIKTQKP